MSLPAFKICCFAVASKKRSEFLILPSHVLVQTFISSHLLNSSLDLLLGLSVVFTCETI